MRIHSGPLKATYIDSPLVDEGENDSVFSEISVLQLLQLVSISSAGAGLPHGSLLHDGIGEAAPIAGRGPVDGKTQALGAVLQLMEGSGSRAARGLAAGASFDYLRSAAPDAEGGSLSSWSAWDRWARTRFDGGRALPRRSGTRKRTGFRNRGGCGRANTALGRHRGACAGRDPAHRPRACRETRRYLQPAPG